jgi:hypothetical protein
MRLGCHSPSAFLDLHLHLDFAFAFGRGPRLPLQWSCAIDPNATPNEKPIEKHTKKSRCTPNANATCRWCVLAFAFGVGFAIGFAFGPWTEHGLPQ